MKLELPKPEAARRLRIALDPVGAQYLDALKKRLGAKNDSHVIREALLRMYRETKP